MEKILLLLFLMDAIVNEGKLLMKRGTLVWSQYMFKQGEKGGEGELCSVLPELQVHLKRDSLL